MYICNICNIQTKRLNDYNNHLKTKKHLKNAKELSCCYCNKIFNNKYSAIRHQEKFCKMKTNEENSNMENKNKNKNKNNNNNNNKNNIDKTNKIYNALKNINERIVTMVKMLENPNKKKSHIKFIEENYSDVPLHKT